MKAWAQTEYGGVEVLKITEVPKPHPRPRDLLVKVFATATNPVDGKVRKGFKSKTPPTEPLISGWDAAGVVEAVGGEVTLFKPGDEVYFAGVINRPGANAEYTCVDERIVGHKPKSLSFKEAAAEPLTILTAWEAIVEGMHVPVPKDASDHPNSHKSILVIAGAGGTGSIGVQIAKRILKFGTVIATASREETIEYSKKMGADHVIDHKKDLLEQIQALGLKGVNYVYNTVDADSNFENVQQAVLPLGAIANITTGGTPIDVAKLFGRRISFVWEIMFARALFDVEPEKQGAILNHFAGLYDSGLLQHRAVTEFAWEDLPKAQALQDSGTSIGKIILTVKF